MLINDDFSFPMAQNTLRQPQGKSSARHPKSKKELVEIRKKMMKTKFREREADNKSDNNMSGFTIPKEDDP